MLYVVAVFIPTVHRPLCSEGSGICDVIPPREISQWSRGQCELSACTTMSLDHNGCPPDWQRLRTLLVAKPIFDTNPIITVSFASHALITILSIVSLFLRSMISCVQSDIPSISSSCLLAMSVSFCICARWFPCWLLLTSEDEENLVDLKCSTRDAAFARLGPRFVVSISLIVCPGCLH